MAKGFRFKPNIDTDARSVFVNGKSPTPAILGLLVVPVIVLAIALADSRLGFKLFMASASFVLLTLVVALFVRGRALRTGEVHIDVSGPLRFIPSRAMRVVGIAVALACLVPAAVALLIAGLDLPAQQGFTRFTTLGPYVLAVVGLWLLAQEIWSMRLPLGLRVDSTGLRGVRGGKRVDLEWSDLVSATAFGRHGPKLLLLTANQETIVFDAHHIGSDPAIVARVIEHFKAHPAQRSQLNDGVAAIRRVEASDS